MVQCFKDYFSGHSGDYRKFRPEYPDQLFSFLAGRSPRLEKAWDCATGNGQAARGLASHFGQVFATDGSLPQVAAAPPGPNLHYAVSVAERSCFRKASIDLITVGQAMHWFDFAGFFAEVDRVLVKDGVLAFWCYGLGRISPAIDEIIRYFFFSVLGPFWPPERRYIEEEYRTIPLPMVEIPAPHFAIRAEWNFPALLGYLDTWSAVKQFRGSQAKDPFAAIIDPLRAAWGKPDGKKAIIWPVFLRMGRKR